MNRSDPASDGRATLTDALKAHVQQWWSDYQSGCSCAEADMPPPPLFKCSPDDYWRHIADVIAGSDWLREIRAEAWEVGRKEEYDVWTKTAGFAVPLNPYREDA